MLKGLDIYLNSGAVEWHKVAEDGNAFVFARAAYGTKVDKSVISNVAGARAAKIKVGVYHFVRAGIDPQMQLKTLMEALDSIDVRSGDLPPVIDIEDNPEFDGPWLSARNKSYLQCVHAWIDAVTARVGKPPIIYTRAGFWEELGNPPGFNHCPLWVASYRKDAPTLPAQWADYTFWQYSDKGQVDGIAGNVDVSCFNGDADELANILI